MERGVVSREQLERLRADPATADRDKIVARIQEANIEDRLLERWSEHYEHVEGTPPTSRASTSGRFSRDSRRCSRAIWKAGGENDGTCENGSERKCEGENDRPESDVVTAPSDGRRLATTGMQLLPRTFHSDGDRT
ncbi:hypothetical protein ACFQMM_15545 [Saliphagus sp. GCM10025308]